MLITMSLARGAGETKVSKLGVYVPLVLFWATSLTSLYHTLILQSATKHSFPGIVIFMAQPARRPSGMCNTVLRKRKRCRRQDMVFSFLQYHFTERDIVLGSPPSDHVRCVVLK